MRILFASFITSMIALISYAQSNAEYKLIKQSNTHYCLQLKIDSVCSYWELPYPVYRFQVGDVNGDGSVDAIIGVIKKTRHDAKLGKRVFIFKNYHGLIRPLWMGSRLGAQLIDFRLIKSEGVLYIRSIEQASDNTYFVANYRWHSFGMQFVNYLICKSNFDKAFRVFHNSH